jgi:hypothetical protein
VDAELVENVVQMDLHRCHADEKRVSDLPIRKALGE